jgi:CTP synthase (UTP-ammonia lyase)
MSRPVTIGIIGEYDPKKPSHPATMEAIAHAAEYLSIEANVTWLSTPSFLTAAGLKGLKRYDGLWISPGSPYQSQVGALNAVREARTQKKPFFGN